MARTFLVPAQGQSTDAIPPKTAEQDRAQAPRNRGLKRVQAAVTFRNQRVLPKSHDNSFLCDGEYGRDRRRPHRDIRYGRAFTPFSDRFGVEPWWAACVG